MAAVALAATVSTKTTITNASLGVARTLVATAAGRTTIVATIGFPKLLGAASSAGAGSAYLNTGYVNIDRPWWPDGYIDPAFIVQRQEYGAAVGGDYVRGSTVITLPHTALRYPTTVKGATAVQGKAFLAVRAADYDTSEVAWGWPPNLQAKWREVALIRSGFGYPITVNDGQTVFRATQASFSLSDGTLAPPPLVLDKPLQSGQFYYYSLFFKTSPFDWVLGMSSEVLIPRNFHHGDHLWDTLPPFYQYTDSNMRVGNGFLRQFLSVFGFELDTTREFVEQWQETYHVDKSPISLLRKVGENFGVPYRAGIGDIRYRALIAALPAMLQMRGTSPALEQVVESMSKYDCDIVAGTNLMLLPDDSDFFSGTGNWTALHPTTDALDATIDSLMATDVHLSMNSGSAPPAGFGRGIMRVVTTKALETSNFALACGDGFTTTDEIVPLYAGVPVEPGGTYGFSVNLKMPNVCVVACYLLWFDADGQPSDYLSKASPPNPLAPPDNNWNLFSVQGTAPANATYAVPVIYFTSRPAVPSSGTYSIYIDIAGASLYLLGNDAAVNVAPPDSYLTMGDPGEKIGAPPKPGDPTFKGFILGTPT